MQTFSPFIPGSEAAKAIDYIPGVMMLRAGSKGTEVSFPIPGTDIRVSSGFNFSAEESAEKAFEKWRQMMKHMK